MSFPCRRGIVAWLIIYRIMVIISTMSYRGLTPNCFAKILSHATMLPVARNDDSGSHATMPAGGNDILFEVIFDP
nr:hypothetical protein [Rickettsia endosymbiont of Ceutorhynchus assimilis]